MSGWTQASAHRWPPQEERFWAAVTKTDECWLYSGALNRAGYGRLRWNGRAQMAHRVALDLIGVAVPPDMEVDHLCQNRACVNPAHLELVTHLENVARTKQRRRPPCGHVYDHQQPGHRRCRECYLAYHREYDRTRRKRITA